MRVHLLLVGTALLAMGCPGSLENPQRFASCPPGLVENELLVDKCGSGACHDADDPEANLDLVSPDVRSRLADVASDTCSGRTLIDSADPGISFMLEKLYPQPECGSQMPHSSPPLSDQEVECIRRWVVDGEVSP